MCHLLQHSLAEFVTSQARSAKEKWKEIMYFRSTFVRRAARAQTKAGYALA